MDKIGFIGVGIMGKSMVRNLMKSGYEVQIYARHPKKVEDVVNEGAKLFPNISECIKDCNYVITIVGYPKDVEEVYFDKGNILDSADEGAYLIDMTTTSPSLAVKIYEKGKDKFHIVDAPVSGGDAGAQKGELTIFVGGSQDDCETLLPIFKAMGTNINYFGKNGLGQHAKMANQIMIAGAMAGVCEAFAYAESQNIDINTLIAATSTGSAGSTQLSAFGKKMIDGDFAPGFYLKHFIKDMKLANEEAKKAGKQLEVLDVVLNHYLELENKGLGDLGTQALYKFYKNN